MKHILSIIFVSALVFSATAGPTEIFRVLTGFTKGLDHADLNPTLQNCSESLENAKLSSVKAYLNFVNETKETDLFEKSVAQFGYDFAHSIRTCGKATLAMTDLWASITDQVKNLTREELSTRLLANLFTVNQKWKQYLSNLVDRELETAGQALADIFNILVFNKNITSRTVRKLGEITKLFEQRVVFDLNATVLGVLGFIEEANTTIVVNDYLTLVNDTTFFASQFPALENAIESFDFGAVVSIVTSISKYLFIVTTDAVTVQSQAAAFVQRDLPLFTDEQKITKAVEALFSDLPTTFINIERIVSAYKYADYRELGHGTGGVYNQLRNGALSA
jgi:hypothetical protein